MNTLRNEDRDCETKNLTLHINLKQLVLTTDRVWKLERVSVTLSTEMTNFQLQ